MSIEVIAQAQRVRCYECQDTAVDMVCHHCGRAMCKHHGPARPAEGVDAQNLEYEGLDLSPASAPGVHCQDCLHYIRTSRWMTALGVLLAIISAILLLVLIASDGQTCLMGLSAVALLGGIGLAVGGGYLRRRRYAEQLLADRLPFPLVGGGAGVAITESTHGRIELSADGRYTSQTEPLRGELSVTLQFGPRDRQRIEAYSRQYNFSRVADIPYNAGFVVLAGRPAIRLDDPGVFAKGTANTIPLTGKVGDHTFLVSEGREGSQWAGRWGYSVLTDEDGLHLPVQIVPALIQEGAGRGIGLAVQISSRGASPFRMPSFAQVEELVVHAAQSLGRVEGVDPPAIIGTGDPGGGADDAPPTQTITWKNVVLDADEQAERRKSFSISFRNPVEPETVLTGRLRVRFSGTLSGLDRVDLFNPTGKKWEYKGPTRRTYIDVDFRLDLAGLRFQEPISVEGRVVREQVVPDNTMITALTNAISEDGFYVKRIIENPPRTSKTDAHITNRYWDVAGRFYEGVYPIDFHLVFTGEEVHGRSRPYLGKTQIDFVVQGAVADEEMRGHVTNLRDRLERLINSTLDEIPVMVAEAPPAAGLAPAPPEAAARAWEPAPQPVGPPPGLGPQPARLQARLEKLDDALLDGRISEGRYEEMRSRIEAELARLGRPY